MAKTYSMSAPDGNTYQVEGPDGASDDAVRAEILRQHPGAGTKSPYSSPAGSSQPGGNWMNDLQEALGGGFVKMGNAVRQIVGKPTNPETGEGQDPEYAKQVEADIAEHAHLDKPLMSTIGGNIGSFAAKAIPFAVAPEGYLGAMGAGALTEGLQPTQEGGASRAANVVEGAAGGAVGNAVGGLLGAVVKKGLTAGGSMLDDVAQDAVKLLRDQGLTLTLGQQTGRSLAPTTELAAQQAKELTAAGLKQMGVNSERASTAVMDAGRTRLQNTYDELAARLEVNLSSDQKLQNDLLLGWQSAKDNLTPDVARLVQNRVEQIFMAATRNGKDVPINGTLFKNMHDSLDKIADPSATGVIDDIQQAMRQAMTRASSKEDAALLAKTDQQYGAMKALEKSIGTNDRIDPVKFNSATDTTQGASAAVYGRGPNAPLAKLAQASKLIMVDAAKGPTGLTPQALIDYATKRAAFHAVPAVVGGYEGHRRGGNTGMILGIAAALGGAKLAHSAGSNPAIANAIAKWASSKGINNAADAAAYLTKQPIAAGGAQVAPEMMPNDQGQAPQ